MATPVVHHVLRAAVTVWQPFTPVEGTVRPGTAFTFVVTPVAAVVAVAPLSKITVSIARTAIIGSAIAIAMAGLGPGTAL